MWIAVFPFMNPITCATEYFGGIDINICTWSIIRCPSCISLSFCRAKSRKNHPNSRRSAYNTFFRHFGMNTIVIFAFPRRVFQCFICLHVLSFRKLLSGSRSGESLMAPGAVKLRESLQQSWRIIWFNILMGIIGVWPFRRCGFSVPSSWGLCGGGGPRRAAPVITSGILYAGIMAVLLLPKFLGATLFRRSPEKLKVCGSPAKVVLGVGG